MNKKMTNPNGLRRRGFTMIELLVVIAILLVLGFVVFAGSRAIRDRAEAARMVANMRQMVTMHQTFTVDHGFLVNQNDTRIGGVKRHWSEWFSEQITMSEEPKAWDATMGGGSGVFTNPAAYRKAVSKLPSSGHNSWRTYCYNNQIGSVDPESLAAGTKGWTKGARTATQVEHPEKLVLFSQRKFSDGERRFIPFMNRAENGDNMDFDTFKGRLYVAFYDGSVRDFQRKNWPDAQGTNPVTGKTYTVTELNRMWWGRDAALEPR